MLHIFICEDNERQREDLERMVKNYILIEDLDIKFAMSTNDPQVILNYLNENPEVIGLYFLDIDLQHKMTGFVLGTKIRERDVFGRIVFITTHGELMYLTFIHQIEAMDYIIKGQEFNDIATRVGQCIKVAYQRYLNEKKSSTQFFKVTVANKTRVFPFSDIMFFTTSVKPHKLSLHLENSHVGFVSSMKEVEGYSPLFVRIHNSFIVNIENIKTIDRANRELEMINGEKCLISVRGLKELEKGLKKLK
jgi:two-component system response regulator AgrA